MAKNYDPTSPSLYERKKAGPFKLRHRVLFIPRLLLYEVKTPAFSHERASPELSNAHKIAERWADLDAFGKLSQHKETSIDTQFLDQLFGEGLGYRVKTNSPDAYEMEHKFAVPGVGIADAAFGQFSPHKQSPLVVVELKDANTDLDRDRSNGRTAVQQCWDYINALPDCQWGIVSNFVTLRLYHRSKTSQAYQEFALKDLRNPDRFAEFYYLFHRNGLLPFAGIQKTRTLALLEHTKQQQEEVGDKLYKSYQLQRFRLIEHLKVNEGKDLNEAIRIAQKILDRVIFIAFCEDRDLLPPDTLKLANETRTFARHKNPLWRNLRDLFTAVDQGLDTKVQINAFNGGLFAEDPAIDALELDDVQFCQGFVSLGVYDYSDEVNVDVLGHLFERSITELEKLRVGGLFALKSALDEAEGVPAKKGRTKKETDESDDDAPLSKMPKSAQRKRFGIYYTPPAFTSLIVERTVDALIKTRFSALADKHGVDPDARADQDAKKLRKYWSDCLACLKAFTICDPACGSGAFLIRAYDALEVHYKQVVFGLGGAGMSKEELAEIDAAIPDMILAHNLYGVDLSREGVEITQLALWIRSARPTRSLVNLSGHILHGNSLVSDPAVDDKALNWPEKFPQIFSNGRNGFDCIIGNPPWERVKFQHRRFFALQDQGVTDEVNPNSMRRLAGELEKKNPELHTLYIQAVKRADVLLAHARECKQFPLTAKGDLNLYMLFAEKAKTLVADNGRVGLLVPSGIATDDSTKEFFNDLMDRKTLISLYDFENRKRIFEDVDGRFKFSALVFSGGDLKTEQADFVSFAHDVEEVKENNKKRHIALTAADMKLLNPNTKTCPVFRTRKDADLTRGIYKRIPILVHENRKSGGNVWGIKFLTMYHQSGDSEHFIDPSKLKEDGYKLNGTKWVKGKTKYSPLYEAKMIQAYDHRAASIVIEKQNWLRKAQTLETTLVEHQNPEYGVLPRWWVNDKDVSERIPTCTQGALIAFKNVTSPTNHRTMIASFIPVTAVGNSAPLVLFPSTISGRQTCALLANWNSFVYDFITRQKIGGVNLSYFIIQQLPTLTPDTYADKCPWAKHESLEHWISERVLKLSCTADDMKPLAQACDFDGSEGHGIHKWREPERLQLRADLDAAFAHLYGLNEEDFTYILSTFSAIPKEVVETTLQAYRKLAGG